MSDVQEAQPFVLNGFDGQQLAGCRWPAQTEAPAGVLLVMHGYGEHAARHGGLATAAARAGFDVWSFDQRNHGNSPGAVRGSVRGFEPALSDLAVLQNMARESVTAEGAQDVPHFLFGHSMGGAISLRYVLEGLGRLDGLVLSSPFLKDAVKRPALITAGAPILAKLLPGAQTAKLDARSISRDPAEVQRYVSDPLVYQGGVRADAGATMLEEGARLLALARTLSTPTLVVHGSGDKIADVAGSRRLAAVSGLVTLIELEGGYHELHHDLPSSGVPAAYRSTILDWLNKSVSG